MRKRLLSPSVWYALVVGAAVTLGATRPVLAAGCMDEVQHMSTTLGVTPSAPAPNGASTPEPPATTESRGISPEVTSRLTAPNATPGNPIAARRSEVLALLQAARAASAQGNEQECLTQVNKARSVLRQSQP